MKSTTLILLALVLASLAGGCSKSPTAATTATTAPAQTVIFTSTLVPPGAASHTFTITQSGPIAITMSNVPTSVVGLGFGTPNSGSPLGCSLSNSVVAAPDTNAQITSSADPGVYCLEIFDVGNLTIPISFYITLTSGAPATTTTTTTVVPTVTEDFSGTLDVGGTNTYQFDVAQSGVVTATLNTVSGNKVPATVALNLGIGTFADGTCTPIVANNVQAGGSSQVTSTLSPGASCVQIADVGNLVNAATFDITIVHP